MAKVTSIQGKARGKVGAMVYAVSGGQQIVREYNPIVANPSTAGQVAQRAKLKLMTQLGSVMAPVIAIPKNGMISARNKFVSKNFALTSYADNKAAITLDGVQLTDGHSSLPGITANNAQQGGLAVALSAAADASISRVVYSVFKLGTNGEMSLVDSQVISEAGQGRLFPHAFAYQTGSYIVYAYGMRDLDAAATAKFENMNITSGTSVAQLVATRTLSTSDYQFTATTSYKYVSNPLPVNPDQPQDPDDGD